MRTTLTIDDDIATNLLRLRQTRQASLKHLINEALRRGLRQMTEPETPKEPCVTRSVDLGRLLIPDLDNVAEAIAIAEGEWHR